MGWNKLSEYSKGIGGLWWENWWSGRWNGGKVVVGMAVRGDEWCENWVCSEWNTMGTYVLLSDCQTCNYTPVLPCI